MSRIVCPKCRAAVRVSDREHRLRVPCIECGYEVPLADAEEYDPKKHKKKAAPPLPLYAKILVWAPALAALLIGTPLALAGFFWGKAAVVAAVVEFTAIVGALVWGAFLASEDGAYVGLDYLHVSSVPFSFVVLILLIGLLPFVVLYLLSYVLYLYFTVFQFGIRRPMRYAPVLAVQVIGLLVLMSVLLISLIGAAVLADW
jgi:hypothetical protein